MTFDIIGAGIGGLSTAIALEQKGFKVRVFEQAKKIKTVGAGIIIANNAMQVYEKLGLKEIIEHHGNPISSMNITKDNLKPLSKIDLSCSSKPNIIATPKAAIGITINCKNACDISCVNGTQLQTFRFYKRCFVKNMIQVQWHRPQNTTFACPEKANIFLRTSKVKLYIASLNNRC